MSKARDLANAGTALTTVSATELGYLDGVTSAVQTQINSKIGQSTAINPTIVDAKGDIIAATAADTPARLAVGNNGETLVADSSTSTGLRWQGNYAAGKNKIINGDFGVWQRGTSFTNPTDNTYTCDRYKQNGNGSGFTKIWSRQTFTPGTAPVAGYESAFFYRFNQTVAGTGGTNNNIAIYVHEDVRTFAGQTVTLSFWAKADATRSLFLFYGQEFNSGSGDQYPTIDTATLSTSWTRYTFTFAVDSIAGKTIGSGFTGNFQLVFNAANNITQTIDLWGIQLEAGRVATPFQTATGTAQGELAACQRYYERQSLGTSNMSFAGFNNSTTNGYHTWHYKVTKRTTPTIALNAATDFSVRTPAGNIQCTSFSIIGNTIDNAWISTIVASGLTTGNGNFLVNSGVSSYIEASAEL